MSFPPIEAAIVSKVSTDSLTGLLTRRAFLKEASAAFEHFSASQLGMAAILLDLDHFKRLNAEFGREAGDEALRWVAHIFRETLRPRDLAGRYHGEEFAALLQCAALADACRLAQRIQSRLQAQPLVVDGRQLPVIVSLGVFFTRGTLPDVRALFDRAGRALSRAKHNGRDCWVCEEEP